MLTNLAEKVVLNSTMIKKSSNAYKLGSKNCIEFHYDQKVQQCLQIWQQKLCWIPLRSKGSAMLTNLAAKMVDSTMIKNPLMLTNFAAKVVLDSTLIIKKSPAMLTNLAVKVVLDSTMIRKSSNAYKLNSKSCVGFRYDKKIKQCLQTWQKKLC